MKVVEEGIGEHGIPYRIGYADDSGVMPELRILRERGGCCAWRGRTVCDEEPVFLVMGGVSLTFAMYREVHKPGGLCHALACDRHFPDVKRDMPLSLRRSQRKELLSLLASLGAEEDGMFVGVRLDEMKS